METSTPRLPVRVSPVLLHPREQRLSLSAHWRFRLDPDEAGLTGGWFSRPDVIADPIAVPGCWQGQGFGHDGEDEVWDFRLKARVFRATYRGTGWYARTFRVPNEWHGRRLWLNFGGAHPSAQVWLNGKHLGGNDLPFVPFGFEVTGLARQGADNEVVVRVHEHNRLYGLAYNWQGNWSGFYRDVELTATGAAALHEVRLLPNVETERLRVQARAAEAPPGCALRLVVSPADGSGTPVTAELPVLDGVVQGEIAVPGPRLWSPDGPQLYHVEAELVDGHMTLDAQVERTGFVRFSAEGNRFLINGEPYYIRGTGDFVSCPETGCPDTDRDRWRRKLQTLRSYGYNQVRCQSYVYAPEYFEAADEVGLLVQSEMGMLGAWGGHNQYHVYAWPAPTPDHYSTLKRQWDLVVRRDANHPSAAIYCMSNELGRSTFFPRIAWRCYHDTKAIKPHALVLWTDGGYNPELPGDFVNANWPEGQTPPDKPVIEHEFRWWSSFPDVRLSGKYSGAIRHYAGEIARQAAQRRGQGHLLEVYAENSQRLQFLEAKTKMEQCRRDRAFLAGISHFNAMDANPSPQGVIDEFCERKLVAADTWLQTNGDTVILSGLDFDNRVLQEGEVFRCPLYVSDFSHPPFAEPVLRWALQMAAGEIASGKVRPRHQPFTTCPVGEVECVVPQVDKPSRAELHAEMTDGARTVTNTWSLWVFPATKGLSGTVVRYGAPQHTWVAAWAELPTVGAADLPQRGVVLAEVLDETLVAYMDAGGTVLLAAGEGLVRPHAPNFGYVRYFLTPPANYGPYEDGQNGTVIRDHPLLGDFPHEGFADLPFFRMMDGAPPLALEPLGLHDEDPIIRTIHRYPVLHPLGYLVERSCGAGRLILSALDLQPPWPETRYLLDCICRAAPQAPARPFDVRHLAGLAGT
jgi:beta-galactosidase